MFDDQSKNFAKCFDSAVQYLKRQLLHLKESESDSPFGYNLGACADWKVCYYAGCVIGRHVEILPDINVNPHILQTI
ncbi:hypothetical protein Mal52_13550 [Symmachiella dynata]|uniref:Uncharacterized protein n=1 Tax=Symmachiella dynata TaxID=2527995 RepID=A0A517ZKB4_9PLAN|nr:hypothetical protein Mal52_13550 [Symmachiella dynata]